jgi:hypothetical protein
LRCRRQPNYGIKEEDEHKRITEHFNKNEALRDHPRFSGIFNRSRAPASNQPTAGTALADVSNLDSNAVAGPSNPTYSYTNLDCNFADQSIPRTPYPLTYPHALNNPAFFNTPSYFGPPEGGQFYDSYNAYLYNIPDSR